MNIEYLKENIHTTWAGKVIYAYEEIDSTNVQAKRLAMEGAVSGALVLAESQTQGKGRRGRVWESPRESSIYMSLMMRPQIRPENASMLTLVMGLSVVQAIEKVWNVKTGIKWPNDVVWNKKKLVGILTEMSVDAQGIQHVVIGVGINVNTPSFPEELQDKATSAFLELGHVVEREPLIIDIMEKFEQNYAIFEKTQNLAGLKMAYEQTLLNKQQPVRVLQPGNEYVGIALGINDMGELLVNKEDGKLETVYAGEVSVRGLYSYAV